MSSQEESTTQRGWEATIRLMKKMKIPVTKQNFLDLEYMGNPPKHMTPEQKDQLPPQWR